MSREEKLELLALLEEKERRRIAETIDCSAMTREQSNEIYDEILASENGPAIRKLCKEDLFFLLTRGCKRKDIDKDWLYARCREVQASPDGHLDLWAREHYKSTIITFGKSIQDILKDPDNTLIGIFSHTRPIAKGFLEQIKRELEANQFLKDHFPDVLYQNPKSEAPKWSLDNGIMVKRKSNPKESSVEAWGLVDGQPTSKHFTGLVYDDVVTRESVTTPEQIKKVTSAWELSLNLGAHGGWKRYIGTRYHVNDTYRTMMDRGSVNPRIYPATDTGKIDGEPVFLTKELLMEKRRDMGPYTFGTQMLQDPVADKAMSFKKEWLKYYETLGDTSKWNKYILVDPASKKKKTSDYTVMEVIALAPDGNYYLIDAVRDRLNLTQRTSTLFDLHEKHKPIGVGYEQYGMQSDIEHIQYVMEQRNYRFNIHEVGGSVAKEDRIKKLIPIYEQGRFYMPKVLTYVNYEGEAQDYIKVFVDDEYLAFPVCIHDDMLDCRARILEVTLGAKFPKPAAPKPRPQNSYSGAGGWMG
jgi:predicted phage terminase large subunit-like protein